MSALMIPSSSNIEKLRVPYFTITDEATFMQIP